MNIADIVALAKAGFTAEQIAAMSAAPAPAPTPAPATAPAPAPAPAPTPAPAPAPAPAEDPMAKLMEQLGLLRQDIQSQNISNSNQPKVESVDDILASIINPTDTGK